VNYFEDHIGDYAAATAHLSWDEDMAYTRLIRAYYHAERPIPRDQTYRLARASTPAQRKAVDTVIAEFFWLGDDGYHQKRCDEEIARYQDKQSKAKASANKRWAHVQTASDGNANASANAMRTHMPTHSEGNAPRARPQTPDSSHQTPDLKDKGAGIREVVPRTPGSDAAIRMKAAGLQAVNPSHPKLLALLDAGITVDELAQAAGEAVAKGKNFAYALATAEGRRRDAAVEPLPDRASITVPSRQGPDPTLARLEAERAAWTPPAPEVKAMLAQTVARLKGAAA
jgi:uncharacterized protein YdaU (DUF1376 family)